MPHTPGPVAWLHIIDSTDGCPENEPWRQLSFDCKSPFGVPGVDYDESFPVTSKPLYENYDHAPELYALLKEIEFAPDMSYGALCPICREDGGRYRRNNGHAPECRLAAVLKAVEGET